jgi:NAD(P)-dependent dehydrogenase (short-subunit alcohol dehydrogenase family)
MVMGVIESDQVASQYPELAGARVLITGLESGHGVDIARAFAEHGCRMVLQTPVLDTALDVLLETLVQDAAAVHITEGVIRDEAAAVKCAQSAVGVYGGLDVVINLARLDEAGLTPDATEIEIEDRLADTLRGPLLITRVIANRMQLTWREGLILNVVTQRGAKTSAARHLGRIANAAVAALTRREAERWADKAVRVNAIAPGGAGSATAFEADLQSEPEIAAVALRLASDKGKSFSGMVFDAGLA